MDEYLSKPLKQTQMMQTILKCTTLGGPLLEKSNNESRLGINTQMHGRSRMHSSDYRDRRPRLDPRLEPRAYGGAEGPTGSTAEAKKGSTTEPRVVDVSDKR
ncbi:hypothetical protein FQN49_000864 [Arthroderma sp. PD_2]|nr:hypothetical protein FQN49_000864 [Arthroderma sp. PD_2]